MAFAQQNGFQMINEPLGAKLPFKKTFRPFWIGKQKTLIWQNKGLSFGGFRLFKKPKVRSNIYFGK